MGQKFENDPSQDAPLASVLGMPEESELPHGVIVGLIKVRPAPSFVAGLTVTQ